MFPKVKSLYNGAPKSLSALKWFLLPMVLLVAALACNFMPAVPTPALPAETEVVEPPASEEPVEPAASEEPTDELPATTKSPALSGDIVVVPAGSLIRIAYQGLETGPDPVNPDLPPSTDPHPFLRAVRKGLEDFGPIFGFDVELVTYDDRGGLGEGASSAAVIVSDPQIVAVLGPVFSSSAMEALPVYEALGIPTLSGAATLEVGNLGPTVFNRTVFSDAQMASLSTALVPYTYTLPLVEPWQADFIAWGGAALIEGPNSLLPYQYDAAGVLMAAIQASSTIDADGSLLIDRDLLRQNIRATASFPGVTGPITITANGDRALP